MAIHPNFADWYRSAALTPPEGLLEKRWAGVEAVVKKPSASLVLSLAKLFSLPNATESFVPAGFRDPFRNDESFPSKNNVQELRVLAGAVLRVMVEQHQPLSPLSALALVSGSFGPREAASLEAGHLENAQRFLLQHAAATRRTIRPEPLKIPAFTKEKLAEKLPQLAETITEITAEFSSTLKQAQIAIGQLAHVATVREEEVAILWWLQARFSRDIQKSFSEIGYATGTLVFPMELADLTKFVPGLDTMVAVLVHSLQLAGAPSSSEAVTIANATNATPRDWREKVCARHRVDSSGPLSPILLAIHKSLETDGRDEWLPVYRKACDIPVDKPFPVIQLSLQLFRERMLLRALDEAKP